MSTAHTLTIEYLDAQGQVQRTEQLQGEHFTLRVQSQALDVTTTQDRAAAHAHTSHGMPQGHLDGVAAPSPQYLWQRITPAVLALILLGLFSLVTALDLWVEYNPDDSVKNLVTFALGLAASIALWAAFWALLGKIFTKHANYWEHVCLVLFAGIVFTALLAAMHFASFSFSWRALGKIDLITLLFGTSMLAWAHLRLIVSSTGRANLRLGMLGLTLACVALLMWTNHRRQGTVLDRLHAPHLYRPTLQLTRPISSQDFFNQARALEAPLKSRAAEIEPGEDNISGEED